MLWRPSRYVWFALFGMTVLWLTLGGLVAFGQEAQVRHYQSEILARPDGNLQQSHVFVGADGRMGAVVLVGPEGQRPVAGAVSGPRTYTDVDDDGNAAFCFTVDDVEGVAPPELLGQVSCYVWLKDDSMFETGNTPFGEATSPEMLWCGEQHLMTAAPPSGDPARRST